MSSFIVFDIREMSLYLIFFVGMAVWSFVTAVHPRTKHRERPLFSTLFAISSACATYAGGLVYTYLEVV
jgi:hypothetical protein